MSKNHNPPLPMDELEIVNSYRASKSRKSQLKVLAELNDTDVTTIADILTAHGEKVDKRWLPKKGGAKTAPPIVPISGPRSAAAATPESLPETEPAADEPEAETVIEEAETVIEEAETVIEEAETVIEEAETVVVDAADEPEPAVGDNLQLWAGDIYDMLGSIDDDTPVYFNGSPLLGYRYIEEYDAASSTVRKKIELF